MSDLTSFLATRDANPGFTDHFGDELHAESDAHQTSALSVDWTYGMMYILSQRILLDVLKERPTGRTLLDVGSQTSFVLFASSFCEVSALELRCTNTVINLPGICNIQFAQGKAESIPAGDETFDIVTSLHAIEHFGLGRYGDQIDYYGDQRGVREFARVLKRGGTCIAAVPTATRARIQFNSQRVYRPQDLDSVFASSGMTKRMGLVSYAPGSREDQVLLGEPSTLDSYNPTFTPPVYVGVYQKP